MDAVQAQKTLIVVAGPTAVGKTGIAISLGQRLNTEIISADSRQCYQGMSIGTAQPSIAERALVKHHFIDSFNLEDSLSAADFEKIALKELALIFEKKDVAIVCGGTGLYIKALCEGLDDMPNVNPEIEQKVNNEFAEKGIQWLQQELNAVDAEYAAMGEMSNPTRMLRALIFKLSVGQSISAYRTGIAKKRPFRIIKIALDLPRELLYNRINMRVDMMMNEGLLQEAKALIPYRHFKSLNTVGYAELFDYFDGRCDISFAVEKIKQHSRNYAKRQITWFKKDHSFHWILANDKEIVEKILQFL